MNEKIKKTCRLCLNIICDANFDVIEEISKHMLEVLLLNMVVDISKEPVMCSDCATNLQKSFDFKSFCLNTETILQPFCTSKDIKLSLMELYLRDKRNHLIDILEDQKICRICIKPIEIGCFMDLHEAKENIFVLGILQNHIPEVDLSITEEPVICKSCHHSFQHLYSFIQNCCSVEETVNRYIEMNGVDDIGQIDLSKLQNANLKSQLNVDDNKDMQLQSIELVLKTEIENDGCMENDHSELTVKQEEIENISEQKNSESLRESSPVTTTFSTHKNTSVEQMFKCPICSFETKYRRNVKRHMMIHKTVARRETNYECEWCTFKTNNKINLKNHILSHKNSPEVVKCEKCGLQTNNKHICDRQVLICENPPQRQPVTNTDKMYKCAMCTYATNDKSNLKKHTIRHKNPTEVTMHTCDICSYQAKKKCLVDRHRLIHKKPSEVTMYRCDICLFGSRYKGVLKTHVLTHQNPQSQRRHVKLEFADVPVEDKSLDPDVKIFKCETCSYESKYKFDIKKHMLIHLKPSEVMMYKCETCMYETRFKSSLNRHLLIHRDPSEVVIYKCEFCSHKTRFKSKFEKHLRSHDRPS